MNNRYRHGEAVAIHILPVVVIIIGRRTTERTTRSVTHIATHIAYQSE